MSPRMRRRIAPWIGASVILLAFALAGCGADTMKKKSSSSGSTLTTPTVSMSFPDSLTGGTSASTSSLHRHTLADGTNHCDFVGNGGDEPFDNGYHMSKFLIGIIATWQCITDDVMGTVAQLGFLATGQVISIDNGGDASQPSALSITLDSSTQTTVRFYYNGDTTTPNVFLSWNTVNGVTTGKLVINTTPLQTNAEDPSLMRMDFTSNATQRFGDMYIFFNSHPFVNGFRIQVTENLDPSATPVFTALGRVETKAQWDSIYQSAGFSTPLPALSMYTIADASGVGAADALFTDVGWGLDFDTLAGSGGNFGNYRYDKNDRYFFTAAGASEWVDKSITSATYDGVSPGVATRTDASPFAVADILTYLPSLTSVSASYFTASPYCFAIDDSCLDFLKQVFANNSNSWSGQEPNGGADPGDWRSPIMAGDKSGLMLTSVWPDGASSWSGVFAMAFTP